MLCVSTGPGLDDLVLERNRNRHIMLRPDASGAARGKENKVVSDILGRRRAPFLMVRFSSWR